MNPKKMHPLSAKHPDRELGLCQDLSITLWKITNGTVLQPLSGGELFITAVMAVDECFDGILDRMHDTTTALISDTTDTIVIQIYSQEGCPITPKFKTKDCKLSHCKVDFPGVLLQRLEIDNK